MKIIDLRSDTLTKPSAGMRKAIYEAEVGDDVYKEDPTVNELERYTAELFGKEAALYVPSGLMSNQILLNVLTNPGDEIICESDAHIFIYESGSPAALSGIQVFPVKGERGILNPKDIEPVIRPTSAYYMPRTKVIEIENTHNRAGGSVYRIETIKEIRNLAEKYNLYTHLDGARIWNAHIASGIELSEYAKYFDTVSVCLSKGLGAPVGSVMLGSKDIITEAYRVRKAWGGGMRQVGIIAAGGLYAVKNNIPKLKEDHEKARILGKCLNNLENAEVDLNSIETNILMFSPKNMTVEDGLKKLKQHGILANPGGIGSIRLVTYMDLPFEDIQDACKIFEKVFS